MNERYSVAKLNKILTNLKKVHPESDFGLDFANGGVRLTNASGSIDVSPRMKYGQMADMLFTLIRMDSVKGNPSKRRASKTDWLNSVIRKHNRKVHSMKRLKKAEREFYMKKNPRKRLKPSVSFRRGKLRVRIPHKKNLPSLKYYVDKRKAKRVFRRAGYRVNPSVKRPTFHVFIGMHKSLRNNQVSWLNVGSPFKSKESAIAFGRQTRKETRLPVKIMVQR